VKSSGSDVRKTFSKIYKRYDLANSILSAGRDATWRKNAVSLLNSSSRIPYPASRIFLDLCTGTGKLAFETSQRFGAEVIGLDFTEEMMKWGRDSQITNNQLPVTVSFVLGDAQVLPFQENLFDGVIIGFGIRNIPDVVKALSEMYRVVKPGGRAIILEFSRPQSFFLLPPYNFYLKNILPWIGGFLTGERPSYSYLAQSISEFPIYEDFLKLMKIANWEKVNYYPLSGGIATIYTGRKY
jgi:demethylmenaquinone methyltransferase/2-methoxy-6-polyprenyl-1,4-benzoquinol methylase